MYSAFLPTNTFLLKHKMPQLIPKISPCMAPTCFGPSGQSSEEHATKPCYSYSYYRDHQLKYTIKIFVQWQYTFLQSEKQLYIVKLFGIIPSFKLLRFGATCISIHVSAIQVATHRNNLNDVIIPNSFTIYNYFLIAETCIAMAQQF